MIDLLIQPCGQLLTLAGCRSPRRGADMQDIGLVEHGALGINLATGVVEYAGPASELESALVAESCPTIDAGRCVVMPGFVDSHTHLVYSGSRADEFYARSSGTSYQEIAAGGGGIVRTVEATRATSPAELERLARKRLHKLYDCGTTTVEIKSGYGLSREHELMALEVMGRLVNSEPGLVLSTCLAAHAIPPEFAGRRTEYVELVCALLLEASELGLADFYDIFIDQHAFTQAEAERIVHSVKDTLLGLRVHGDEFADDDTAAWAARQGALSVDHLCCVSDSGIAALVANDTIATLLPGTMFYTHSQHYAPARKLIDAGCAVALATDHNPGSSLVYSMPFVLTLATLMMGMTPEECITAATVNGAHALGVASLVGTLEPGKRADFMIVDLPDYRELPCHIGANFVRDVYIRGRAVKSMGHLALRA